MRLIDRICGWREITVRGAGAKRFSDRILKVNIPAELLSDGEQTTVRVGRDAAKRLLSFARENGIDVTSGTVRGLPAFFASLLRRPGIVCGVILAVLFLVFARSRVWEVRIVGDGSTDEDTVREIVYAAGLRPGMKICDVYPERVSAACLGQEGVFSGVNVSLSGVVATVEWIGRHGEASIQSSGEGGVNLVASCDGVIVSVEPTCGTAFVVPGQTVHKGDLLISGVTPGGAVKASGRVMASVTQEFTVTEEKTKTVTRTAKRRIASVSIRMFGEEITAVGDGGDSVSVKEMVLPGGVVLPLSLRFGYAHTSVRESVYLTEAEVASIALRRLALTVREALAEGELRKQEIDGRFTASGYVATAKTEYLINIAEPLAFTARNE